MKELSELIGKRVLNFPVTSTKLLYLQGVIYRLHTKTADVG